MKSIFQALRLTVVLAVFLSVSYVAVLWLFARVAGPNEGRAEVVELNGKVVGAARVGQSFTTPRYFWGRPSAAGYDATASSGSNKGATNAEYIDGVEARIDTFLVHHPYLKRSDVPAEMVTASASGLDPHITPQSARVQALRVAKARGLDLSQVSALIEQYIEQPLAGMMGTPRVSVLHLNRALDALEASQQVKKN